jgi:hypothetical protein
MVYGVKTGKDLLNSATRKAISGNPPIRVHWGPDLDTITGEQA